MDDLKKFIKWYKKLIEGSREDPPPEVWNNISEKLEIDEVWDRMATQMDYEEGIAQYERWSYAPVTALALLALLNGYLLSSRPGVDEYTLQQPELIVELKPLPVEISESITFPILENSDQGPNDPHPLLQKTRELQSVPVTVNSGYSKPDVSIPRRIE
ncbi:MAG: hypothetical protein O7F74_01365, partial [Bacteroidetes bacterium]|nr:hypothetical protein [Bacteroidota bacterium]